MNVACVCAFVRFLAYAFDHIWMRYIAINTVAVAAAAAASVWHTSHTVHSFSRIVCNALYYIVKILCDFQSKRFTSFI